MNKPPPESVARHGFAGRLAQKVGLKDSKVKVENETSEDLTVFHAPLPLVEGQPIGWKCITILPKTKVVVESGEEGAIITVQVHRHDGYFTPYWQRRLTHQSGYKLIVRPEKLSANCWTVAGNDGKIGAEPAPKPKGYVDTPLLPGGSSGSLGLGALGEDLPDVSGLSSQTPHNDGREMRLVSPNLPPMIGGMPTPTPNRNSTGSGGAGVGWNSPIHEDDGSEHGSPVAAWSGNQASLLAAGAGPTKVAGPASEGDAGAVIKEAACPVCKQPVYGSQPRTKNPEDNKYYHMVCWQPGGAVATRMPGDQAVFSGVEVKSFPPKGRAQ